MPGQIDLDITRLDVCDDAGGRLLGSDLHPPTPRSPFSLKLQGWALAPEGPPRRVRVVGTAELGSGEPLRRILVATPPNKRRADVAARFPEISGSESSGFTTACSLLGLPRD